MSEQEVQPESDPPHSDASDSQSMSSDNPAKENNEYRTAVGRRPWFGIRKPVHWSIAWLLGISCVGLAFLAWFLVTRGATPEERIVSPQALPSPADTFVQFESLWFERALTRNIFVTLKRVTLGFLLAAAIGVPLGVLAGCFPPVRAFLSPLIIFGRNIPLAALIPLTFFFFGIGELQKVIFIFIACVAFVIADTITSIMDVGQQYIDTSYTLGANRRQTIMNVMVPLAMPSVFNSLRLLFGLAFGYVMLAELVRIGNEAGGLGNLINVSQRQGPREHIYLIILIIPLVALLIDRLLFRIQRGLFPYRYGGIGMLNQVWKMFAGLGESVTSIFFKPQPPYDQFTAEYDMPLTTKLPDLTDEQREKLRERWQP